MTFAILKSARIEQSDNIRVAKKGRISFRYKNQIERTNDAKTRTYKSKATVSDRNIEERVVGVEKWRKSGNLNIFITISSSNPTAKDTRTTQVTISGVVMRFTDKL